MSLESSQGFLTWARLRRTFRHKQNVAILAVSSSTHRGLMCLPRLYGYRGLSCLEPDSSTRTWVVNAGSLRHIHREKDAALAQLVKTGTPDGPVLQGRMPSDAIAVLLHLEAILATGVAHLFLHCRRLVHVSRRLAVDSDL